MLFELRELLTAIGRITGLAIGASVAYGVVHDQVTARICPEYFTLGHVDVGLRSPTLLGLYWGVAATWWVGLLLGLPAGALARVGRWPRVEARELIRPIGVAIVAVGVAAIAAGVWSASVAQSHVPGHLVFAFGPAAKGFYIDWQVHRASYGSGAVAGLAIWGWILVTRLRRARRR